jgi:hypothetical protein
MVGGDISTSLSADRQAQYNNIGMLFFAEHHGERLIHNTTDNHANNSLLKI